MNSVKKVNCEHNNKYIFSHTLLNINSSRLEIQHLKSRIKFIVKGYIIIVIKEKVYSGFFRSIHKTHTHLS